MRGRAGLVAVVTALGLVAAVSPAVGADHPVNPATGVALSPCFSDDHGTPVIRSIHLSRSTVDVTAHRRTVDVVVDVIDTGGPGPASGVDRVLLSWDPGELDVMMRRTWDGTWRTTITVPKRASAGTRTFWAVAIDRVGNSTPTIGPYGYTPEPQAGLQVSSMPDGHDPVLRRVRLSRTRLDALSHLRKVEVSVLALDRESGVFQVSARLDHVKGKGRTPDVLLRRVSGDAYRGRWVGTIVVPLWAHGGRWQPVLFVQDRFGRFHALARWTGSGLPLPTLRVRSAPDAAAPALRRISVAPNAVDVRRKGRTVVVDVRATDAQSGVAAVDLEVGTLTTPLPARLVAGTRHDGVWRTTLEVGRCDVAGDWMVRVASIADRRGHAYDGYAHPDGVAGALTVVNADRVAPTIASQKEDTDSLQVDFTEDVVGIGDTGAAVYSAASPLGLGDRLTGSWQCADAAGAQADCLRGPVRTATFAADQPFPAGSRPGLVLNPEHVLDVTDLAGNPAGDARRVT